MQLLLFFIALHAWAWGLQKVADIDRLHKIQGRYIPLQETQEIIPEKTQFIQSRVNFTVSNLTTAKRQLRNVIFKTYDEENATMLSNVTASKQSDNSME